MDKEKIKKIIVILLFVAVIGLIALNYYTFLLYADTLYQFNYCETAKEVGGFFYNG